MLQCPVLVEAPKNSHCKATVMKKKGKKEKKSLIVESVLCLRIRRLEMKSSLLCPVAEQM